MNQIPFLLTMLLSSVVLLSQGLDTNHLASLGISVVFALFLPKILHHLAKDLDLRKMGFSLLGTLASLLVVFLIQKELALPLWLFWPVAVLFSVVIGYSLQEHKPPARGIEKKDKASPSPAKVLAKPKPKILDTSVIIDGRIVDIVETGFVEGPFVVPNFVLREIQLISDSPEGVKRSRGRRGLDILNQLQKKKEPEVTISYHDYPEIREVDSKLIKLTKDLGGVLVTNDYNLNKVAEIEGIRVLNINNLAMALKPVVLPGEDLEIQILREGKDENQGIGYLEDGTMVVVESGGKLIGKKVKVLVNSVLQTNAGKMIFTKIAGT